MYIQKEINLMLTKQNTLELIIDHGLTVRQIPFKKVCLWGYRDGAPIIKGAELVEENGRRFMREVRTPAHAGKWMAKKCIDTGSEVHWNIKTDNLSDTLQEAVAKATQTK
jgi:hypothetical protein